MGPGNEKTLTMLVFLALGGVGLYRLVLWLREAPRTADPWGADIDKTLAQDNAVPLCHHCLTPQQHNGWFCPECGATFGPYCNYMPYIYVFSQGEVLRAGVLEHLRCTALIVIGYIIFSLGMFSVGGLLLLLVPIYWFFLFRNLSRGGVPLANGATAETPQPPSLATPTSSDVGTFKKCPWCGKEYPNEATICPVDGHELVSERRTQ